MTTIAELKQKAIVNQMALYVAEYPNECEAYESIVYIYDENVCHFLTEEEAKKYGPYFSVPIQELIDTRALIEIPNYPDERKNIGLKSVDQLIVTINFWYEYENVVNEHKLRVG